MSCQPQLSSLHFFLQLLPKSVLSKKSFSPYSVRHLTTTKLHLDKNQPDATEAKEHSQSM